MTFSGWSVKRVQRNDIKSFIETYHYSGNINGCISDYCYALFDNDDNMMGAMFFGRLAMANQWKKYSDNPDDVIELRRLVCLDESPRNSESFFIGKALRLLKKEWNGKIVVSYADPFHGHTGIVYKASNFKFVGKTSPARHIIDDTGKIYHDKATRTKYNGELKPFAKILIEKLNTGMAKYVVTEGKMIYVYKLR